LRVTLAGRWAASGGVDPASRWRRSWDGQWRLLMFDLPSRSQAVRLRLWRWLRASRFGYLQNSVWLSPDFDADDDLPLRQLKLTPEAFLVIQGRPAGSDTDAGMVQSAWDFETINRHYQRVCELADRGLELAGSNPLKPVEIHRWVMADWSAWLMAIDSDPLLPEVLLPADYLGREAWRRRNATLAALAQKGMTVQNM
jgi:phenylacetic acid degradation operon negative regulatory protein